MKKFLLREVLVLCLSFLSFNLFAGHLSGFLQFSARLNGSQEVPAVSTNALGVASFILSENRDSLCVNFSATGLSGMIDGMHIHDGLPGINGGVVLDLSSMVTGNQATGVITGTQLTTTIIEKMLNGQLYLNVHTAMNPNGEIRGQIKLETDAGYYASLSGSQEVPAVSTNAYGLGTFNLSLHETKLDIKVIVQNLSGAITGAHLHNAAMGSNGGVVQDLGSGITGNMISLTVDPTSFLPELKNGNIYINIHTAANPSGEIRGQVTLPNMLFFDASLNGAQEVPAVTTNAMGLASFGLSKTFDMMMYDVVLDGLSGPITGAHLHMGAVGSSGGVAVDLSAGINGNRIMGTINAAALTNDVIHDLVAGNIYLNVHTSANPGGEIRGQVYRLAREGYNLLLDGMQEVPMVSTNAYGGGMVSVNRDQSDAHYMFVVGGLSGSVDGAHFHNAAFGANGPVLFDLSGNVMNNGAFGYLKSTDATPFNTASSVLFRNESVYLNVHTMANMNGEIRGQVVRGEICSMSTLGIDSPSNDEITFELYPNPVNDQLKITSLNEGGDIFISDIQSKVVLVIENVQAEQLINVDHLENGTYLIKVGNTSKVFIKN